MLALGNDPINTVAKWNDTSSCNRNIYMSATNEQFELAVVDGQKVYRRISGAQYGKFILPTLTLNPGQFTVIVG